MDKKEVSKTQRNPNRGLRKKYANLIYQLNASLQSMDSFDKKIKSSLKTITESGIADYAVVWYVDKGKTDVTDQEELLRPIYWICPIDITGVRVKPGEGIVGDVYLKQRAEATFNAEETQKMRADFALEGLNVFSVIAVPFNVSEDRIGCLQFINTEKTGGFTEDDMELCDFLSLIIENLIKEPYVLEFGENKNVLLSVHNIHKYFQTPDKLSHVLKGVNFDVYEGELLCFLGESGCGKTTILNIIGGLETADDGEIIFEGMDITKATEEELTEYRRKNVGFIFQKYNLMPNLNIKQNLDLFAEIVDNPIDSVEALRLVGLEEKQRSYPATISGGQQQRVSIARAIVKNTKLILADEPTAALDYETSIEVLSAMENNIKDGTTMIIVTHNREIAKMANRVITFRNGMTYEITVNANPMKASELVW